MFDLQPSLAALTAPLPLGTSEVVVVFRYDKIGDLLVTSPLFRAIKASRPHAYVILVASPYNRDVLAHMPEIDRIVVYDERASLRDRLRFGLALRRLKPSAAFVMSPNPDGYWLARLSGARQRAGVVMSYRTLQLLTAPLLLKAIKVIHRRRLDRGTDRGLHVSEIALQLAARSGFPRPANVAQSAPTSVADRAWAAAIAPGMPPRRIVLHLGGTWRVCGLSETDMVTLAAQITRTFPSAALLMTAGPADQSYFDTMRASLPEPTFPMPPERNALLFSGLSMGAWSALIETADLVVTPDTGAVHLASAHQRPVVAVYNAGRHNAMTSMFGPWETPYRTLRGGLAPETLLAQILGAMQELLPA